MWIIQFIFKFISTRYFITLLPIICCSHFGLSIRTWCQSSTGSISSACFKITAESNPELYQHNDYNNRSIKHTKQWIQSANQLYRRMNFQTMIYFQPMKCIDEIRHPALLSSGSGKNCLRRCFRRSSSNSIDNEEFNADRRASFTQRFHAAASRPAITPRYHAAVSLRVLTFTVLQIQRGLIGRVLGNIPTSIQ